MYTNLWYYILKDNHILDLIGHVAWLHKGIKDNEEAARKNINYKDRITEGISSQVDTIIVEAKIQFDTLNGMF